MSRFVTTKKSDIQLNVEYLRNQKLSLFEPAEPRSLPLTWDDQKEARTLRLTWNNLKHLYPDLDDKRLTSGDKEQLHDKLLDIWNSRSPYLSLNVFRERTVSSGFVETALEIAKAELPPQVLKRINGLKLTNP